MGSPSSIAPRRSSSPSAAPRRPASLAALAVGLAYDQRDDHSCARELLDAAPDTCDLQDARSLLARWRIDDPDRRHRAVQLLDRALDQAPDDGPHQPDSHRWVTDWSQ